MHIQTGCLMGVISAITAVGGMVFRRRFTKWIFWRLFKASIGSLMKEAVIHHFLHKKSLDSIAQEMGLSLAFVKMTIEIYIWAINAQEHILNRAEIQGKKMGENGDFPHVGQRVSASEKSVKSVNGKRRAHGRRRCA